MAANGSVIPSLTVALRVVVVAAAAAAAAVALAGVPAAAGGCE